jgi:hypothetical protein
VTLRRRTPWEASDLGLAMMQRWWRPVYAAHAAVMLPLAATLVLAGWLADAVWLAIVLLWWLEPLYDRVVLHVLSRAVFGGAPEVRAVLAAWRQWLRSGLFAALTLQRLDLARSFNLPVAQLEGGRGREARARRAVLGARARASAVWLTFVWLHFEAVLLWSAGAAAELLLPARLERTHASEESFLGFFEAVRLASVNDALVYVAVILFLEPFYVAAGFALYLNRRTLLEGWDIEVALRRIAARHAPAALLIFLAFLLVGFSQPVFSEEKNAKAEIGEVLKAPEFGHYRETMRWQSRERGAPREERADWEPHGLGYALAKAAEVLFWTAAVAALAYALWWARRWLPRGRSSGVQAYEPPPALFGMELAPESLPPDVALAAAELAREERLREALSLLYRGALSQLVHRRRLELLASHTEGEAVTLAAMPYFTALVEAWRRCAYARKEIPKEQVLELAQRYREAFA